MEEVLALDKRGFAAQKVRKKVCNGVSNMKLTENRVEELECDSLWDARFPPLRAKDRAWPFRM
jgi:hypothetical protein